MRALFLLTILLLPSLLFSQNTTDESPDQAPDEDQLVQGSGRRFMFSFKERPSMQVGEILRVDVRAKWHFDFRRFAPQVAHPPQTADAFVLNRARFGLKGRFTDYFSYEVERDVRSTLADVVERRPWKDVYVDFDRFRKFRIRIGKFKMPFGLEQNTSADKLNFVYRSHASNSLAPGRQSGIGAHGRLLQGDRLNYYFGIFRYDGERASKQGNPTAGRTYAVRLTGTPLRSFTSLSRTIQRLHVGAAVTSGEVFEGANGIQGETMSNFTFFEHAFVSGNRRRTGVELEWTPSPLRVRGEYLRVTQQRKGQGIREEDLPDLISSGWYVALIWNPLSASTSQKAAAHRLWDVRGFDAVELAVRLDVLSFYSASRVGIPSGSPRAANVIPDSIRTWTFGATWPLNRFMKLQANGEREWVDEIESKLVSGRHVFWIGVVRLQVAM